jgi:hypothetical protein
MGYNRGGKNRKDRLKRRQKEENRLAKKAAAATGKAPAPQTPPPS